MLVKYVGRQFGIRNKRLKLFGYSSYQDYLKSAEWKSIKKRINKRRKNKIYWRKCYCCGDENDIQIHHNNYKFIGTGKINTALFPLCGKCHNRTHRMSQMKKYKHCGLKGIMRALRRIRRKAKGRLLNKTGKNYEKTLKRFQRRYDNSFLGKK